MPGGIPIGSKGVQIIWFAALTLLNLIREFFDRRGYVEVETSALQVSPGIELHISPFKTILLDPWNAARSVYLHTSPEFAMKKLLAAGMQRIFQLARVFRNGERTAKHHPEFTMLEWYQTGADWRSLADEAIEFVRLFAGRWRDIRTIFAIYLHRGNFYRWRKRLSGSQV